MNAILFTFLFHGAFGGEIVIATVAQVKDHVISSREVKIQYVLDRALKYSWYLSTDRQPVEQLVREWLLYFEAKEFYSKSLPEGKILSVLQPLEEKLKSVKGWAELEVSREEIKRLLRNKLEARRLFEFKEKASRLRVSSSEVEAEYKLNRARYGTQSIEDVRSKIENRKTKENLEQRLKNWFVVLESRYGVQRFVQYNKSKNDKPM